MADSENCPECVEGAPAWIMTFADLMSLLMCFFVLLLSFAVMDAEKFKQLAGSMKSAFGVQSLLPADNIPKGTSVIALEFSPGKPTDSEIDDIRQQTTDDTKPVPDISEIMKEQLEAEAQAKAEEVSEEMSQEIQQGKISVETEGDKVIIRIQEKGSFGSGSAMLDTQFFEVMERITKSISDTPGDIVVAGHTDDIPISTDQYRSNWELSASRAVTVVHALAKAGGLPMNRFLVEGHGDTDPLENNDSVENRAKNRRVEIVLMPRGLWTGDTASAGKKPTIVQHEKTHIKTRFKAIADGIQGKE